MKSEGTAGSFLLRASNEQEFTPSRRRFAGSGKRQRIRAAASLIRAKHERSEAAACLKLASRSFLEQELALIEQGLGRIELARASTGQTLALIEQEFGQAGWRAPRWG